MRRGRGEGGDGAVPWVQGRSGVGNFGAGEWVEPQGRGGMGKMLDPRGEWAGGWMEGWRIGWGLGLIHKEVTGWGI